MISQSLISPYAAKTRVEQLNIFEENYQDEITSEGILKT